MNDIQAMALVRHELLNVMFNTYPKGYTRPQLLAELRPVFSDRDNTWLTDAVTEQLRILQQASLVRPAAGGYTLTERGRRDRQQAAAMFKAKTTTKETAA